MKEELPQEVKLWYSKLGAKGGRSTSEAKKSAVRKNGLAPCKPGKFRGRPFKKDNDSTGL